MSVPSPVPEPTVIRAGDNAGFLSLVPHLVGCRPRDSVVLIPFAGRRTLGGMRIDLPPADAPDVTAPATGFIGSFARVRHADRIAVIVYTDDAYRDGRGRIARAEFVEALLGCARTAGYGIVEALCVAADGWGSYLEPDGPFAGSLLDEIRPEDVGVRDHAPLADQHAGLELPAAGDGEREAVARAVRGRTALRLADRMLPDAFEDVVTGEAALDPDTLALLVLALDNPAIRDIALSQWSGDLAEGREIQRFNLAWADGATGDFDGPLRLAGEGGRPDPARLRRALEVARKVASVAPRRLRTGALASAAWLSWALGSSTHAAHYVRLAQEINPAHGLADIVATMVRHQHLPAWAYDRQIPGPPPANRTERRRRSRSRRG